MIIHIKMIRKADYAHDGDYVPQLVIDGDKVTSICAEWQLLWDDAFDSAKLGAFLRDNRAAVYCIEALGCSSVTYRHVTRTPDGCTDVRNGNPVLYSSSALELTKNPLRIGAAGTELALALHNAEPTSRLSLHLDTE